MDKLKQFLSTESNQKLLISIYLNNQIIRCKAKTWDVMFYENNQEIDIITPHIFLELSLKGYNFYQEDENECRLIGVGDEDSLYFDILEEAGSLL